MQRSISKRNYFCKFSTVLKRKKKGIDWLCRVACQFFRLLALLKGEKKAKKYNLKKTIITSMYITTTTSTLILAPCILMSHFLFVVLLLFVDQFLSCMLKGALKTNQKLCSVSKNKPLVTHQSAPFKQR